VDKAPPYLISKEKGDRSMVDKSIVREKLLFQDAMSKDKGGQEPAANAMITRKRVR
jgi:hypothetical protein